MTFLHHVWQLDDETLHTDRTFWQNILELDYDYIITTYTQPEALIKQLMRLRRATLHNVASTVFVSFPTQSKQRIAEHIIGHKSDHPIVRAVLLLSVYLQGIRSDILQRVTDFFVTEYDITVPNDAPDRSLLVAFHLLQVNKEALRLYALLNRAHTAMYHHYALSTQTQLAANEAPGNTSEVATPDALHKGFSSLQIDERMVQSVLRSTFPTDHSRCLTVFYDANDDICTVFILRPWRRRAIREFDGMYFGTHAEMIVLEFHDHMRQGRFRSSDDFGVRVASALARHAMQADVQYVPVEHRTDKQSLLRLLTDLEHNRHNLLRLRSIRLNVSSMPSHPTLALAAGAEYDSLGETLYELRQRGINWLADLTALHHVQVTFQQTPGDSPHIFTLYVTSNHDDTFIVTYTAQTTLRAKRSAFRAVLRDEYDISVQPIRRRAKV